MDPIELVAAASGLICVGLVALQSVWNFPIGLANSVLYAYVFYGADLYSDVLLQGCFFVLLCYGWYHWQAGREAEPLPVTRLTFSDWVMSVVAAGVGTAVLGTLMAKYTPAALPYPDAFIASTSLVAQYLIARKKLENWLFWIVVDVVAVGVYYQKDLVPTTVLYAIFTGMAVAGYFRWKKDAARPPA